MALSCASIFACSFSPRRSGALATPVRFMWLQTSSSGFEAARQSCPVACRQRPAPGVSFRRRLGTAT